MRPARPALLLLGALATGTLAGCGQPASSDALVGTWARADAPDWRYTFTADSLTIALPAFLGGDEVRFAYTLEADTVLVLRDSAELDQIAVRLRGDTLTLRTTAPDETTRFVRVPDAEAAEPAP